jgi:hypothetical protein
MNFHERTNRTPPAVSQSALHSCEAVWIAAGTLIILNPFPRARSSLGELCARATKHRRLIPFFCGANPSRPVPNLPGSVNRCTHTADYKGISGITPPQWPYVATAGNPWGHRIVPTDILTESRSILAKVSLRSPVRPHSGLQTFFLNNPDWIIHRSYGRNCCRDLGGFLRIR